MTTFRDDPIAALADDLRYVLNYTGARHAHERPGVWDTSGKPCGHCARLAIAWQNLAAYDALPAAVPVPPPADQTTPLAEVWVVWREDESPHGYFATEDAAKQATIDCWEEDEPGCPDYSWRRDGPRWELVVGGEHGGVYASRHRVYGAPEPAAVLAVLPEQADRAALLRAADIAEDVAERLRKHHEFERSTGALDVMTELRRVAAEEQPAETCGCGHQADEHSVYGCIDGCGCDRMFKRPPMDPVHILGIDAAPEQPAETEPTEADIVRAHVLAVHQIGEQLAGIETWMWEHLANVRDAASERPTPPAPLLRSEDACPGFPERCPNLRTVDPSPPTHLGGIRCGCADPTTR